MALGERQEDGNSWAIYYMETFLQGKFAMKHGITFSPNLTWLES